MTKTLETLAGGMAAMLFAAIASAQVNPPVTSGAPLQPIMPPPPVRLPAAPQAPARPVAAQAQPSVPPAVPVSAPAPVATRTMPPAEPAAAAAPPAAGAPAANNGNAVSRAAPPSQFGDITRGLLALQADGRIAGKPLLMQEPVSEAGWDRYMKSFQLSLPQWFGERVKTGGASVGQ